VPCFAAVHRPKNFSSLGSLIRCGEYRIQKKLKSDARHGHGQITGVEHFLDSSSVRSEILSESTCWLGLSFVLPGFDRSKAATEFVASSYRDLRSMAISISAPGVVQ
jgi:hypothetical protein